MIFVFGSNERGIHGAGAAHEAYKNHGARWSRGFGHYGESFAIPTKGNIRKGDTYYVGGPLDLGKVRTYVKAFLLYAKSHPDLTFKVTRIGCGLAGFSDTQIAPLFAGASHNCQFDTAWKDVLGDTYTYWGHV